MNGQRFSLALLLVALNCCIGAATLRAANPDADRFLKTAKQLILAINTDDSAAIQATYNAQMQQALPPDKSMPFFRGLVTTKGKLKEAGAPRVTGPTAIVRVSAERGAWDFKITLDPVGKIAGLLVTEAAAKAPATASSTRFIALANKLIRAINSDDSAAIQASLGAQMQQALPPDKATPFFRELVTAKGKLKKAGTPQVTGPTAIVRVSAERGDWDFKITLEPSGKIAELLITDAAAAATTPSTAAPTPAAEAPAPPSAERFTKVTNKLFHAINHDDSAAIQAIFDAQMQQAMPPDKATPFFRGLVTDAGRLKKADAPQITGSTAIVRVTAERAALDFKITLDAADKISGLYVTPSASDPAADSTSVPRSRTPMQLPFRGEWYVFWGGDNEKVNYHVVARGQRRAADLIIKGPDDLSHKDPGRRNEDYFVYGKEILAAAAGTVVTAVDGVPDNDPGSMNSFCAVGNCLIIDHGSGEFAVYAHLQPNSLRVHRGDKVSQGQVLALCGNSGNSSEPHLHFHVQDKAALQDGAGITPYFTGVHCRRGDATLTDAEYTFLQGDRIQSTTEK
jgi:murein DD-endopeptidase MepM/ murein hydrolase activator NlpD